MAQVEIVDYIDAHIYDEPILLISEDGENLNSRKLPIAYEVDERCWVNNHAHVLKVIKGSRYLVSEYFNFTNISDFCFGLNSSEA
jgi:type I restriction enzyme S subunit